MRKYKTWKQIKKRFDSSPKKRISAALLKEEVLDSYSIAIDIIKEKPKIIPDILSLAKHRIK